MNIRWRRVDNGLGDLNPWIAMDENDNTLFSVCAWPRPARTHWGVFHEDVSSGHCGDLPFTLEVHELQAAAIAVWRMR